MKSLPDNDWLLDEAGLGAVERGMLLDFLGAQSAETLAGWLHELAMADRDVERQLLLCRSAGQPDELKGALGKLLNMGGFLDYRGAMRYAAQIDAGIKQLRALLPRDPAGCRGLCEYALKRFLAGLRETHRRKTRLMGMLDAVVPG